jgi:hypothetical protein
VTALHAVAEQVLAPARHAVDGKVRLRPAPHGVETPPFGPDRRVVGLAGTELFDRTPSGERRAPVTTVRAAAAFFAVAPGVPAGLWTPVSPVAADDTLAIDPGSVAVLAGLGEHGTVVLDSLTLWPEGFDLATSGGRVNYGGSPGDGFIPVPYLYVAPFDRPDPARRDDFWNAPFGAALTYDRISGRDDARAFLLEGQRRLAASGHA